MAEDFEGIGLVDGGFDAQHRALFVVEFDGVGADAMFDAYPFGSIFEVGDDFALEGAVDFAAEESHDIGTGKAVMP